MVEMEGPAPSPSRKARTNNIQGCNSRPFSKPWLLLPADVTSISLCLWTGLVIHWPSGFLLIASRTGSMRITSKNWYGRIFTHAARMQDHPAPRSRPACSSTAGWRLCPNLSGLFPWLDGFRSGAPRTWASAATAACANPKPFLALYASLRALSPGCAGGPVQAKSSGDPGRPVRVVSPAPHREQKARCCVRWTQLLGGPVGAQLQSPNDCRRTEGIPYNWDPVCDFQWVIQPLWIQFWLTVVSL